MDRRRVVTAHRATYPDPIVLSAGDRPELSGREDIWDGFRWLWARALDGREGWIPDDLLDASGRAKFDYSAMELDAEVGVDVRILRSAHGWAWCELAGRRGWIPLSHLGPKA